MFLILTVIKNVPNSWHILRANTRIYENTNLEQNKYTLMYEDMMQALSIHINA